MSKKDEELKGAEAVKAIEERLHGIVDALGGALSSAIEGKEHDDVHEVGEAGAPFHAKVHSRVRVGSLSDRTPSNTRGKPARKASEPAAAMVRELNPDVAIEGNKLFLSCEVPGVSAEDIQFDIEVTRIKMSASGAKSYTAEVNIPVHLMPEPSQVTVTNGILEAVFDVQSDGNKS